jgi:hypothetical protein
MGGVRASVGGKKVGPFELYIFKVDEIFSRKCFPYHIPHL